ncbi:MAG TPA: 2Fe-2S iron-sulfur cluster-binding protein [Gammaproteobacteria bacterium]|jgi:2Fe-2S ferredoxin|nr:2Fe-2S iron-sulfur cluster-binding protein [Gammaproteobacteria bacterium]
MVKLVVTDKAGREVAIDARAGLSVMENIRTLPNSVEAICGGMCACATCHVYVDPDWIARLPRRSYEEQVMLQDHATFDPERSRLSCQIVVRDAFEGLRVTVAPDEP